MKLFSAAAAALAAALVSIGPPAAAQGTAWRLTLSQGGKVIDVEPTARLLRKPFTLSFTGPQGMGYGVIAATDCKDVEGRKTPEQIGEVIYPANVAAEGPAAQNQFIVVNPPAAFKADGGLTAHAWVEDAENDQHSFQELKVLPGGVLLARRVIRQLVLPVEGSAKKQTVPLASYTGAQLCVLFTGLPPVGYMAHTQPRLLRIAFVDE